MPDDPRTPQDSANPREQKAPEGRISRRALLGGALATGAAAAAGGFVFAQEGAESAAAPATGRDVAAAPPQDWQMGYRTLGRTGLRVSEVGFGSYPTDDPDVVRRAYDLGVNYFDTSHCYRGGRSEEAVGRGLKGVRDKVVLTTKWCPHHQRMEFRKENYLKQLDESLMRLGTDHVDIIMNHEVSAWGHNLDTLLADELHEAFDEAKQAGKVRFMGASGHGGELIRIMNGLVDDGRFDVLLCRYSFLDYPDQMKLIDRCAEKNVGFIAMKTLAGARGADIRQFRGGGASMKQAALKWVLSNDKVSNLIISMSSDADVNEYVVASNAALSDRDRAMLRDYERAFSDQYCRFCEACHSSCPEDIRVADILRFGMYHDAYGQENRAIEAYAALVAQERAATKCAECDGPCMTACDYDIPVRDLMIDTNRKLAGKPFTPENGPGAEGVG